MKIDIGGLGAGDVAALRRHTEVCCTERLGRDVSRLRRLRLRVLGRHRGWVSVRVSAGLEGGGRLGWITLGVDPEDAVERLAAELPEAPRPRLHARLILAATLVGAVLAAWARGAVNT